LLFTLKKNFGNLTWDVRYIPDPDFYPSPSPDPRFVSRIQGPKKRWILDPHPDDGSKCQFSEYCSFPFRLSRLARGLAQIKVWSQDHDATEERLQVPATNFTTLDNVRIFLLS
jgi:hypothetical protein